MRKIMKRLRKSKIATLALMAMVAVMAVPMAAGAEPPSSAIEFDSELGVSIPDTITTAFNFLGMFNSWVLLVLGIIFVPVLVGFLMWIVRKLPRFSGSR